MKKEEIKIAALCFIVPLAGMYITMTNRLKNNDLSRFAFKWTLNGLATSAATAIIGWMYYHIR